MSVSDLIKTWTQEERSLHAELVLECLERERSLVDIGKKIKMSEIELNQSLDLFLSRINNLAQTVKEYADRIENI